jgi:sugar phosphate isomerase/epimerase
MTIGLGTYAFFWQWQTSAAAPLTLVDMLDRTADLGVSLFQICDYPAIETFSVEALAELARHARLRGVALELGTRGVLPAHLRRYLELASALDVTLVRSMFNSADHRPSKTEAVDLLSSVMPEFEQAGVTVALETYEQVPVATLVDTVVAVGSPNLGICLDPANAVAALEHPDHTIDLTAEHVVNVHAKDFAFSRRDGWVGFTLAGCPMGEGLLDYDHLLDAVRPDERGINQIVEHWLPWQGDSATTIEIENRWNHHNLSYLRSKST